MPRRCNNTTTRRHCNKTIPPRTRPSKISCTKPHAARLNCQLFNQSLACSRELVVGAWYSAYRYLCSSAACSSCPLICIYVYSRPTTAIPRDCVAKTRYTKPRDPRLVSLVSLVSLVYTQTSKYNVAASMRRCQTNKAPRPTGSRIFFAPPRSRSRSLARSLPSWRHSPVACVSWDVDLQSRVHARASVSGIVPDGGPSAHPPLMSVHTTRMASHRRHHPRCCRRSCQSTQSPPRAKRPRPSHGR